MASEYVQLSVVHISESVDIYQAVTSEEEAVLTEHRRIRISSSPSNLLSVIFIKMKKQYMYMIVTFHEILLRNSTLHHTLNTHTFCSLTEQLLASFSNHHLSKKTSQILKRNLMKKETCFVPFILPIFRLVRSGRARSSRVR